VVIYDDVRAGQRAVSTLTALTSEFEGERVEMRPQLWRFDLLEDPDWFALALADAINTDMLVLSAGSASGLSATVESWLKLCLARKRGTSAAVIALLGPDSNLDQPDSPRLQFVQSAVKTAGLDFFAPGLPSQRLAHLGRVGRNLFPARGEAFSRIEPAQHWGINE
jgi:hypothetical protein